MISAWWLLPAIGLSIPVGFALCLVLAALIKTRPMDGRTYTGDIAEDHDDYDQFLHDLNHKDTA